MAASSAPAGAASWRRAVVPTEHGGWSFLGEPLLLGLLVAPSWSGALIAVAAVAAFLARQPLQLALGDRRRGKRYPRTGTAERAFATFALAAALAFAGAVALARGPVLVPVALAAPLAALSLALDLGRRSREVAAELAGSLALAATVTAIPIAAGEPAPQAFGLWALLATRVVPTVLFVRARLRLDRGEPAPVAWAMAAQVAGVAAAAWLASAGLAPWLGAAAIALLALRAAYGVSPWRPRARVQVLGATEAVLGLIVVLAAAIGVWLRL